MKKLWQKSLVLLIGLSSALVMAANTQVYTENTTGSITVSANHSEFALQLKSNPSTGYMWFLSHYDASLLTPIKHHYLKPQSKMANGQPLIGAPGYEVWLFKMKPQAFNVPQQTDVQLVYRRVSDNSASSVPLTFNVVTQQDNH